MNVKKKYNTDSKKCEKENSKSDISITHIEILKTKAGSVTLYLEILKKSDFEFIAMGF